MAVSSPPRIVLVLKTPLPFAHSFDDVFGGLGPYFLGYLESSHQKAWRVIGLERVVFSCRAILAQTESGRSTISRKYSLSGHKMICYRSRPNGDLLDGGQVRASD